MVRHWIGMWKVASLSPDKEQKIEKKCVYPKIKKKEKMCVWVYKSVISVYGTTDYLYICVECRCGECQSCGSGS